MTALSDSPPLQGAQRTAYLVLGAHRSGTSAATQLLALAGADLPANLMPADPHNPKGYFEPWKIAVLNDERLRAVGSAWDDVFAFPFRAAPDDEAWAARATELFAAEFGAAARPLLKDPRVSVLLPLWRRALEGRGVALRCLIPVRHPVAVAGSLARRDGFSMEKSLLLWSAYMLASEAYSRDLPRAFVGYDALLSDWRSEVARIEAALGGPWPALTPAAGRAIDDFLAPELRHNPAGGELAAFGWAGALTGRVHAWFEAAAAGDTPDPAILDEAAAELARRRADYGPIVSPAARDLDAARVGLRDLRGTLAFEQAQAAAERAKAEAARAEDREILERGWRRDVRRLQAELDALRAECDEAARRLDTVLTQD